MRIRTKADLRLAYNILRNFDGGSNDWYADLKREIRAYTGRTSDRRVIDDRGDSAVMLITLPDWIKSAEMAQEYFEHYEYREYLPSMYDCTGQLFTNWFKIVERGGRFVAYHSISMDV